MKYNFIKNRENVEKDDFKNRQIIKKMIFLKVTKHENNI